MLNALETVMTPQYSILDGIHAIDWINHGQFKGWSINLITGHRLKANTESFCQMTHR